MAIPTGDCDEGFDVCCSTLYDIANYLLSEVYDALAGCYPPAPCVDPLRAYVTVSGGDDGQVDVLSVSIGTVAPSASTLPGKFGLFRATFEVRLKESGWPTVYADGETIMLPDPVEQAAAARHLYSHGEAIHRRLAYLHFNKMLVPSNIRCTNATLGQMSPLTPQGGVVGWVVPVVVDLPWN